MVFATILVTLRDFVEIFNAIQAVGINRSENPYSMFGAFREYLDSMETALPIGTK